MDKLLVNKIRCKGCNSILESKFRHDFVQCQCGTFVDGGLDYSRMGWPGGHMDDWIENLSLTKSKDVV